MEIRLKSTGDTPPYLAELCFSVEGSKVIIQIADDRNREKARYEIAADQFNSMVDMLMVDVS